MVLCFIYNHLNFTTYLIQFLTGDVFVKDNVAINATGIAMRNNPKTFSLVYDELEIGDTLGRGCSSIVVHAFHAPTRTPLALKVINMFDKSKRDQLIREICTLYDAHCPRYVISLYPRYVAHHYAFPLVKSYYYAGNQYSLITFYGSFYREGTITIALEFMDGGSLANVLAQVGPIPERVLASIAYQVRLLL
jgi:serine/threonine protein kinase